MMGAEMIRQMSDEAAERAARNGLTPYVPWNADEVAGYGETRPVPFPNLGSLIPEGWKLVEHRMVDKTGWGDESEPALTLGELRTWVIEEVELGHGYALIEEGQFQVVVGRFVKTTGRKKGER